MTIRNLDHVFEPRSIALCGASPTAGSLGNVILGNLKGGSFEGPIWPVNPNYAEIGGDRCYAGIGDLPDVPDLVVVATPPKTIPALIGEAGAAGARGAVVITAGFDELGTAGARDLKQAMLDAARPHLLRIVGPNCVGVMVPRIGLNASFSHVAPKPGRLAFLSQSGAVIVGVLDWASERGIGFSHVVSLGNMADVDIGDMIDYLARDQDTRGILLYVEAVTHARKFMSAARAASRSLPIVVIKSGRHDEGAKAASSHTGAIAGSDAVSDAAFRRAGMLRVRDLHELFEATETISKIAPPKGDRLAILSNGGGFGVLATDGLVDHGGQLAALSPDTKAALDAVLPPTWSQGNPVDIIGDAQGERYANALEVLLKDAANDAVLVLNCPTGIASSQEAAETVVETVQAANSKKPVLTSWIGGARAATARRAFTDAGIPSYETPTSAARAFMHLVHYRRNQRTLMETPATIAEEFEPDEASARRAIEAALADGRAMLTEPEAKAVLSAYGIPVTRVETAATPDEAAAAASKFDGPVVLKILSPDISHKTDVGGVVLDLRSPEAVARAAHDMRERASRERPDARLDGFTVQEMVPTRNAYELIVGLTEDPQFGPAVLFGAGGVAVEVVNDTALALPPLNMALANEVMRRTRIYSQLIGFRDRPPAALEAIALTLVKVSRLVTDLGEITELDINPLVADSERVIALDARIGVSAAADGRKPEDRLAIRPYPKELEEIVELGDGRTLLVRPVRPEDEPMFHDAFGRLTPEAVRLRFFAPMKALSHEMAARLTQIDYDREMALVLTDPGPPGQSRGYGVSRIVADPDNERAEFAVVIVSDMTGAGLGALLMRRIIDYAKSRGIQEIYGDVLSENAGMLKLCRVLGFSLHHEADEPGVVRASLALR